MRMTAATAQERVAARYIPTGAIEERHEGVDAVVYHYTSQRGDLYAMGYAGTAYHPAFHIRFRDATRREQFAAAWFDARRARLARQQERQAEKRARQHALQAGDIVYSAWGYEQTNIDFYQVVRVVSLKTVEIRKIRQSTVETGFMSGETRGIKDDFVDSAPVVVRRASGTSVLNIGNSRGSGSMWDGRPLYCSWYA